MKIKIIKTIIANFKILTIFIVLFIISAFFVTLNKKIYTLSILEDQFLINFVGTILALSVAIITLLYSIIDKVRESIIKFHFQNTKTDRIPHLLKELKDDTLFIFYILVSVFIISILNKCDIPIVKWDFKIITRNNFIALIKLFLIFLTLFSLRDIIKTLFTIINLSNYLSEHKK
ncbi:hypothetical protein [Clostridium felsineum]|uniref:Uncharacterized protein n=1 Tax=Clostridium felsineum TaxID=36839 RepID=A0A1S8L3D3_9CLOT|nr:hypothetical protein [Clostridium felsineum]URZ07566.1 hypothetical protein CLROS_029050 [Clostridium felsineum]URZ12597.1 hypothetical protein CROST_033200 [Clostridium felsineum]